MVKFLSGFVLCLIWVLTLKISLSNSIKSVPALDPLTQGVSYTKIDSVPREYNSSIRSVNTNVSTVDTKGMNNLVKKQPIIKKKSTVKQKLAKTGVQPLNVKFEFNPGHKISHLNENELKEFLQNEYGFRNLEGKNLYDLRRIWLAYSYDQFYWDVHYISGFPISIVHAYFIMEATYKGLESDLMVKYKNPGGVKYKGVGTPVWAYDDCYDKKGRRIMCEFSSYTTYEEMVQGWSNVLNLPRYQRCKSYNNAPDICQCLYSSGYHTANNWNNRAKISKEYWSLRASFPPRI